LRWNARTSLVAMRREMKKLSRPNATISRNSSQAIAAASPKSRRKNAISHR
jgi:hypothetical protein